MQILERSAQGKTTKRLRIIKVSSLQMSDAGDWSQQLSTLDIPEEISLRIEIPLGIISEKRLVFLDNDLWMCTFELGSLHGSNTMTRHFFLPFDWASTEASAQCCLLQDEDFAFPPGRRSCSDLEWFGKRRDMAHLLDYTDLCSKVRNLPVGRSGSQTTL